MDKATYLAALEGRQASLYRVAWAILENRADVADALQDTALLAWQHRHKLRDERYIGTWLTRICINASRAICRRRRHTVSLEDIEKMPAPPPDASLALVLHALPESLRLPLVLPGVTTTENVLQVENEYCIYTIREAAFDGYGGSVIVDIRAKDDKTLLTPGWGWSLEESAAEVLHADDAGDMTLEEYARMKGYEQVVIAAVDFPKNRLPGDGSTHTSALSSADWNGHEATILMTFSTRGADIADGMLTQAYEFTAYPRTYELTPAAEMDQHIKRCAGEFTIAVEEPLWTRKAVLDGRSFGRGMRINSLTLTGTRLGVYMDVKYELPYYNSGGGFRSENIFYFSLSDGEGNELGSGAVHGGDRYADPDRTHHTYLRSFEAMDTPPETTDLWLIVTDFEQDKTQRMLLILTDE